LTREIAYVGTKFTIAFARERSGSCPGADFFNGLSTQDKAKLMFIFKILADRGRCANPEKVGDLKNGLFEFKSFQIRMPFAYATSER